MKHKLYVLSLVLNMLYKVTCASILFMLFEVVLFNQNPHLLLIPVTCLLFSLSYIARCFAPNRLTILLVHILLGGLAFLLPYSTEIRVSYIAIPVYLFITSAKMFSKHEYTRSTDDIPWPSFLLCLVVYLVAGKIEQHMLMSAAYISALVLLFLYLALVYVDGIENYLRSAGNVSGIPLRRILSTNTIIVGAIVLCLVISLILGEIFDFKNILLLIQKAIMAIVYVVVWLWGMFLELVGRWFMNDSPSGMEKHEPEDGGEIQTIHSIGDVLDPILYAILAIAVLFVLYKLICVLVKWLMQKRARYGDIVETVDKSGEKRARKEAGKKRHLFLSPEERARRYYKQCIERYRYDVMLSSSRTGRELAAEIKNQTLADVDAITDCYEQIRYGGRKADKTLVRTMRRLSEQGGKEESQ